MNLESLQQAWNILDNAANEGYMSNAFRGGSMPSMKLHHAKQYVEELMESYLKSEE